MARRKKGRAAKKARRATLGREEPEELTKAPHTFVLKRGHVGNNVVNLTKDVRKVMEPYTASKLKERRKNSLKDFISVAGPLGVTHLIIFTKTDIATYLRICRLPRGPTLTFRLYKYCLSRDIISFIKKPVVHDKQLLHHPLLVLNNFSGEGLQLKLMATMFQNMFPSINVNKIKLAEVRRCVLFSYDPETKNIEFRHYNIKAVPNDISKPVKKLVQSKIPNLGRLHDISEYLLQDGNFSESEVEPDGPHNQVNLPQRLSTRGALPSLKSALRLTELGPRMTFKLIKIEQGICEGEVLYHDHIKKTPEEIETIKVRRAKKRKLKEKRKKQQEANVRKKQLDKEQHKQRSLQGIKRKNPVDKENQETDANDDANDEDAKWFYKQTGLEPDEALFPAKKKRKFEENSQEMAFRKGNPPKKMFKKENVSEKIYKKQKYPEKIFKKQKYPATKFKKENRSTKKFYKNKNQSANSIKQKHKFSNLKNKPKKFGNKKNSMKRKNRYNT